MTHVRGEGQAAVMPAFVEGGDNAFKGFDFDPFTRLEIEGFVPQFLPISSGVGAENFSAKPQI